MLLSIPYDGMKAYGDFWNFLGLASLGTPYYKFWVEFPPVFPFLSRGIYLLVGGREHAYVYLLILVFSVFQAGSLYLFQRIDNLITGGNPSKVRAIAYGFLLVGLFYGWAYFDSLAVFFLLLGLWLTLENRYYGVGFSLGVGGLLKWFPLVALPAIWKWADLKAAIKTVLITGLMIVLVWGGLYLLSPKFVHASLISQGTKGSWETIWAIIDGNLHTGNFSSDLVRTNAATAGISTGNPAQISPWISLFFFGGIGLAFFLTAKIDSPNKLISFAGFTFMLMYIWSPGYSPQWVLYLLPLILLAFRIERSILLGLVVLLVNLLEWPLLLSRGLFVYLEEIVIVRMAIYLLVTVLFGINLYRNKKVESV